ncbi:MAG: hypothetical protein ACTHK6_02915 [Solirubrobacterales bacterium]
MKYVKMLGLAAIAAAALMAFVGAGSASAATTLTCGPNTLCPAETQIHAVSEGKAVLDAPFGNVECESTVQGHTTNAAGSNDGPITALLWSACGNDKVETLANGSLTIETQEASPNNNGTLKSTGAKVTVVHLGVHCIYETSNTDLGTVTGSANTTSGRATLDIAALIPRVGGTSGSLCGANAPWTGSYEITTPTTLNVD